MQLLAILVFHLSARLQLFLYHPENKGRTLPLKLLRFFSYKNEIFLPVSNQDQFVPNIVIKDQNNVAFVTMKFSYPS